MTGKELLLKAADLGLIEGAVLIQTTIANDNEAIRSLVRAAADYKNEDGGYKPDTPPNVVLFLNELRDTLLGPK